MSSIFREFFALKREEWPKALGLAAHFFLVISVFWIFKPIKKAALTTYYQGDQLFHFLSYQWNGGEAEQFAKVLNMVVALLASFIFVWLSRRYVKQKLVILIHLLFGVGIIYFALQIDQPGEVFVWSFYLFGDLWTTVTVALFFCVAHDLVSTDEAKRIYGVVGVGGVLGGAVGSNFSGAFIKAWGSSGVLFAALFLNVCIIAVSLFVGRSQSKSHAKVASEETPKEGGSFLEGAQLVFSSRYLLSILGILSFYEIVSTIVDFQFTQSVIHYGNSLNWGRDEVGAYFGKVFGITNIVAFVIQLFFTSLIMRKKGVVAGLLILPGLSILSALSFLALPIVWVGSLMSIIDNGLNYSINQTARETLYVPTDQATKYRAKSFIDMFGQRLAKTFGVAFNLVSPLLFGASIEAIRWLSIGSLVILAAWVASARYAAKRFNELTDPTE
jgi:AAA family ATP:ADP antiporter